MTAPSRPDLAFKIISTQDWTAVETARRYGGSTVDRADGYIHMSTTAQLAETARKHYAGKLDLMLLSVDLTCLGCALVWEPSRGGDLFPHLYDDLPLSAVTDARPFTVSDDGFMACEDGARPWA